MNLTRLGFALCYGGAFTLLCVILRHLEHRNESFVIAFAIAVPIGAVVAAIASWIFWPLRRRDHLGVDPEGVSWIRIVCLAACVVISIQNMISIWGLPWSEANVAKAFHLVSASSVDQNAAWSMAGVLLLWASSPLWSRQPVLPPRNQNLAVESWILGLFVLMATAAWSAQDIIALKVTGSGEILLRSSSPEYQWLLRGGVTLSAAFFALGIRELLGGLRALTARRRQNTSY